MLGVASIPALITVAGFSRTYFPGSRYPNNLSLGAFPIFTLVHLSLSLSLFMLSNKMRRSRHGAFTTAMLSVFELQTWTQRRLLLTSQKGTRALMLPWMFRISRTGLLATKVSMSPFSNMREQRPSSWRWGQETPRRPVASGNFQTPMQRPVRVKML